jgi:hypothetical protein
MSKEVQKVNPAFVEVGCANEPEFVACDVENENWSKAFHSHKISMWEIAANVGKGFPGRPSADLKPMKQSRCSSAVTLGPLNNGGWFDDSHGAACLPASSVPDEKSLCIFSSLQRSSSAGFIQDGLPFSFPGIILVCFINSIRKEFGSSLGADF